MPNYNLGKIYKLISNQTDKIYVGSTAQTLSKRFMNHKKSFMIDGEQIPENHSVLAEMIDKVVPVSYSYFPISNGLYCWIELGS